MRRAVAAMVLLMVLTCRETAAQPCPANSLLAATCENGRCDKLLGETAANCPGDCLDLDTHVKPYYSLAAACPETGIFRPANVEEARAAMRLTVAQGRHVRVVGTGHTGSKAICTEHGNVISTERLDAIQGLETYAGQSVVKVQAGTHIWDLMEYLHAQGKGLGFVIPGVGDMTVGGFLAVGGHGSDTRGGGTLASVLVSVDKMDPLGQVRTYDAANTAPELWKALRADLGLLGMTVSVRLRVREQFRVHEKLMDLPEAQVFGAGGMAALAGQCQFLFVTVFRSAGRVTVTCGNETTDAVTAQDARMTLFAPDFPQIFKDLAPVVFQKAACDSEVARRSEKIFYTSRKSKPWLEWTDAQGKPQRGLQAVGHAHRMTELTFVGRNQPKFSNQDWEVAIPGSEIDAALSYVKSQLEAHNLYNPAIGVVIRADRASEDTLMASSAAGSGVLAGEPLYYLEFPTFWPYEFTPQQLQAYFAPYAEMIRYLIANHQAKPHWGKNRLETHAGAENLAKNADRRARFQPWIDQMDPYGVFSNSFYRAGGFTWPQDGQDWTPVYFPDWADKRVSLENKQNGLCLQLRPGKPAQARACDGGEDQELYLFRDGEVFDPETGALVTPAGAPQPGARYALRSVVRFHQCVEKLFGGGVKPAECDNDGDPAASGLWSFVVTEPGVYKLKSLAADPLPCVKAKDGADVGGSLCSDAGQSATEKSRKRWVLRTP